jgi:Holliday junction DNA helicase RuvA
MIGQLRGSLVSKDPSSVVIDVQGVGYQVQISLHTYAQIKDREEVTLSTYLHVREDALILFGFAQPSEKKMFQMLLSVNGVGPSTAMLILSYLSTDDLRTAILQENLAAIQAVKGVGVKTAQRLILELRDKLKKDSYEEVAAVSSGAGNNLRREALSALMTLGLNKMQAEKSIEAVLKTSGNAISLEELVKQALKNS